MRLCATFRYPLLKQPLILADCRPIFGLDLVGVDQTMPLLHRQPFDVLNPAHGNHPHEPAPIFHLFNLGQEATGVHLQEEVVGDGVGEGFVWVEVSPVVPNRRNPARKPRFSSSRNPTISAPGIHK